MNLCFLYFSLYLWFQFNTFKKHQAVLRFKFFNLFLVLILTFCTLEDAFEAKEEEENIAIQRPNGQQYSLFEGT